MDFSPSRLKRYVLDHGRASCHGRTMKRILTLLCLTFLCAASAFAAPRVVVSIAPLHGLTRSLLKGVSTPTLLVNTPTLGHDASLSPSQVRTLNEADLLVWVGPTMETFLAPYAITHTPRAFAMASQEGMTLLGGGCSHDAHGHGHNHGHAHDHDSHDHDPHMWLDPHNALTFVEALAKRLTDLDPGHAPQYAQNLARLQKNLRALQDELGHTLAPLAHTPLFVLHDTLAYVTHAYNLPKSISLSVDPDQGLSLKSLRALKEKAQDHKGACLLGETFWGKSHIEKLAITLDLRPATIDPMGFDLAKGEALSYDDMMRRLAGALRACAKKS